MSSRRLRAFKRWMNSNNVNYSDALDFVSDADGNISVHSLINLQINDLIATIPKSSCLTIKTSKAKEMIEELEFDGALGLSVAMMYEKSLKEESIWDGYFRVLNEREEVPVVWSDEEVELLCGTELHKVVKEDKNCLHDDWKEHIEPLIQSYNLDTSYFGVEQYFSAKSLVSSRSFEIDDYHGYGMVPLADLFNHKTGAEHVHFTGQNSSSSSEDEDDDIDDVSEEDKSVIETLSTSSSVSEDDRKNPECDPDTLEMIIVREVEAGAEIFNTYGTMGNAALLHRYGFTEEDNTYDIVNIDLSLVFKWSSASSFSNRHTRSRHSLWKRLNYSSCISQDSKYFEICFNGEPQIELIILLYIIHLPDSAYMKLNNMAGSFAEDDECINLVKLIDLNRKGKCVDAEKAENELLKKLLMTNEVCNALVSLADLRESLYGSDSLEEDMNRLKCCDRVKGRKLYHSLVLRVSERKILSRLRVYANGGYKSNKGQLCFPPPQPATQGSSSPSIIITSTSISMGLIIPILSSSLGLRPDSLKIDVLEG